MLIRVDGVNVKHVGGISICKQGNQSIRKECFQEFVRQSGRQSPSNQELQTIIKMNGGCMMVDKAKVAVAK